MTAMKTTSPPGRAAPARDVQQLLRDGDELAVHLALPAPHPVHPVVLHGQAEEGGDRPGLGVVHQHAEPARTGGVGDSRERSPNLSLLSVNPHWEMLRRGQWAEKPHDDPSISAARPSTMTPLQASIPLCSLRA